jgi:hypothetical protein
MYGSGARLIRLNGELFLTYFVGDASPNQVLRWISESGSIRLDEEVLLPSVVYAYARDDLAVLVQHYSEIGPDSRWHAVVTHAFHPDGTLAFRDTLFAETLPSWGFVVGESFAERNRELMGVVMTATGSEYPDQYFARPIFYEPGNTRVYDRFDPGPIPFHGYFQYIKVAWTDQSGGVLSYGASSGSAWEVRFVGFDSGGRRADSIPIIAAGYNTFTGLALLVQSETAYAAWTTSYGDSVNAARFMGLPLSVLQSSVPESRGVASSFAYSASPNPFNSSTRLVFTLPRAGSVSLDIFDITGRLVERLSAGRRDAGPHVVDWQADGLPSGVYLARLSSPGNVQTRKLLLIR